MSFYVGVIPMSNYSKLFTYVDTREVAFVVYLLKVGEVFKRTLENVS